jgi:hypothetical protein
MLSREHNMSKFYTIVLCCTLLAAILGCESKPVIAPEFIGTWQYDDSHGIICLLRFKLDGTFDGYLGKKEGTQITFTGTWRRNGDRILYTYEPSLGKDEDKIVTIESNYFIIQAKDGAQRRYRRINDEKGQVGSTSEG